MLGPCYSKHIYLEAKSPFASKFVFLTSNNNNKHHEHPNTMSGINHVRGSASAKPQDNDSLDYPPSPFELNVESTGSASLDSPTAFDGINSNLFKPNRNLIKLKTNLLELQHILFKQKEPPYRRLQSLTTMSSERGSAGSPDLEAGAISMDDSFCCGVTCSFPKPIGCSVRAHSPIWCAVVAMTALAAVLVTVVVSIWLTVRRVCTCTKLLILINIC